MSSAYELDRTCGIPAMKSAEMRRFEEMEARRARAEARQYSNEPGIGRILHDYSNKLNKEVTRGGRQ